MNNKILFFCLSFEVALLLCHCSEKKITVKAHSDYTTVDETGIINEVDKALLVLADGIVQKDAQKIFSIFKEHCNSHYVRQGHIYPSIKSAEKQYTLAFTGSNDTASRKFTFTQKHYDVFGDKTVLFTGIGVIENSMKKAETRPWIIAYTILWIKEDSVWKAVNMHISWGKK